MIKFILLPLLIILLLLRIDKKPFELPLYAMIFSSTFPFISDGYMFAFGNKGFAFRVEYIFVILGAIFLFSNRFKDIKYKSMLKFPIFMMFIIYLISVPNSIINGMPGGYGVSLRVIETYLFFFIIIKITNIYNLKHLVNFYIGIGFVIALISGFLSITMNKELYNFLFNYGVNIEDTQFFQAFYQNLGPPRLWLIYADEFMPLAATMSFVLFLIGDKKKYYGIISLIFIIRVVLTGERLFTFITIFGYLFALFVVNKYGKKNISYFKILVQVLSITSFTALLILIVPVFTERYLFLLNRLNQYQQELENVYIYMGPILAIAQLNNNGFFSWLIGLGSLRPSRIGYNGFLDTKGMFTFDINTPIIEIYRFGIIGFLFLLYLIKRIFTVAFFLLKRIELSPEEYSIVISVLLYIIGVFITSIFRSFSLAFNFNSLSGFIILLSWLEIIYRDRYVMEMKFLNSIC